MFNLAHNVTTTSQLEWYHKSFSIKETYKQLIIDELSNHNFQFTIEIGEDKEEGTFIRIRKDSKRVVMARTTYKEIPTVTIDIPLSYVSYAPIEVVIKQIKDYLELDK